MRSNWKTSWKTLVAVAAGLWLAPQLAAASSDVEEQLQAMQDRMAQLEDKLQAQTDQLGAQRDDLTAVIAVFLELAKERFGNDLEGFVVGWSSSCFLY